MQAHQGKKDVQRVHQNDLSWEKKEGKISPKKRWETLKKKKKKKEKRKEAARLKTQKGGLGKI